MLGCLLEARNTAAWSSAVQEKIAAVTGDDAAMSTLGVGADFKVFQKLFAPRVAELASEFIEPLDEVSDAVTRLEHELEGLRSRKLNEMTEKWNRYKSAYERYLRAEAVLEDEEFLGSEDLAQIEPIHGSDSDTMGTSTDEAEASDGDVNSEELSPEEPPEPLDDSTPERNEGASS